MGTNDDRDLVGQLTTQLPRIKVFVSAGTHSMRNAARSVPNPEPVRTPNPSKPKHQEPRTQHPEPILVSVPIPISAHRSEIRYR